MDGLDILVFETVSQVEASLEKQDVLDPRIQFFDADSEEGVLVTPSTITEYAVHDFIQV